MLFMQLVWILLIAAAITVIEILIYHYRLPRFFLFIFPLINICLQIDVYKRQLSSCSAARVSVHMMIRNNCSCLLYTSRNVLL